MAIAYFCRDTAFHMSGREFKLNQEITTGLWQAQELRTGRFHEFSIQALQESYAEGKLILWVIAIFQLKLMKYSKKNLKSSVIKQKVLIGKKPKCDVYTLRLSRICQTRSH